MFAQVYYFDEWRSWAVTLYDAQGNLSADESTWSAHKGPAVHTAEDMLLRGEIDRYEVFSRDGRHQITVARTRTGIKETRHPA